MRLLTIGTGNRGAAIADLMAKNGVKVNKVPLFKCCAISNELELLKTLKAIKKEDMFHIFGNLDHRDLGSILNTIYSKHEIFEGALIFTSLDEEFGFSTSVQLSKKIGEITNDPIIALGTIPYIHEANLMILKERIKELRRVTDILILFEEQESTNDLIIDSLNVISMVGEMDIKKKGTGEVVVDTSDVLNSMKKNGVSIISAAQMKLPPSVLRKVVYRDEEKIKGLKTSRMIELFQNAVKRKSIGVDIKNATSALIIFSGDPEEMTMDGFFSCIKILEEKNPELEIRYGDHPVRSIPILSNSLSVVLIFSGIKKLKFNSSSY